MTIKCYNKVQVKRSAQGFPLSRWLLCDRSMTSVTVNETFDGEDQVASRLWKILKVVNRVR